MSSFKQTNKKTILHIDINSYFATVLQQENPQLRDRPIGVVKDHGRTCIIAASKEAKALGAYTGMRKQEAQKSIPGMLYIPATFDRYLATTKRLQALFFQIAPSVYMYSLDEAFIDITDCKQHLYKDPEKLGFQIQQRIKKELGEWVTCNVGISHNRLLAKMTSEVSPKGSITTVSPDTQDALLARVTFKDVCGIGYRLAKKLCLLGVKHPYQIRFYTEEELQPLFGPFWSKELLKIAYGKEPHFLELLDTPQTQMKSVGRSITGYRLYTKDEEIKSILSNLCLEVIDKVRTFNSGGRTIWLGLYGREMQWSTHITLQTPIQQSSELIHWMHHLYKRRPNAFPVIKFAIRLSLLEPHIQSSLLPAWQKNEAIQKALDAINKKYGIFTARPASINAAHLIRPEVTGFLGDRLYQLRQ